MTKKLFITGTGTDVGKTYISALILKKLRAAKLNAGYYKAAVSGADDNGENDASFVARTAGINDVPIDELVSYRYKEAVSPHLAAKLNNRPIEWSKVAEDFAKAKARHDYVLVEGSGGIVCPLREDAGETLLLEALPIRLNLPALIVANAQLGSINAAVLTVCYLQNKNISVKGIIVNNYDDSSVMERDNVYMMEKLTKVDVVATLPCGAQDFAESAEKIAGWFG